MASERKVDTWMPLFVADYLADTKRLTLEEHGAYLLLILDYWRNGPPPDDDAVLARICGVQRKAWLRLRPSIERLFGVRAGTWKHKRIDAEREAAQTRSGKAAQKARDAANARWARDRDTSADQLDNAAGHAPSIAPSMGDGMLGAMHEQCPPPVTYSSVPSEQAPSAVPPDRNKEAWTRGPAFLASAGMVLAKAKPLFGRILRDHHLQASELLASIVSGEGTGTRDPQAYLVGAARSIAQRRGGEALPPDPTVWTDDQWSAAVRLWRDGKGWSDRLGPEPGKPGCRVPQRLLVEQVRA